MTLRASRETDVDIKRKTFAILAAIIIAVGAVGSVALLSANAAMTADIASAREQLSKVKGQIDTKNKANQETARKNANEALGISDSKKTADDKRAAELFADAFTWDSYETYNQMRACLTDEWGLDASGSFMAAVAPEVTEIVGYQPKSDAVGKYDVEETRVNEIDANHLNLSYKSMESYLMDINAEGGYEYFARIVVESVSTSGGTATRAYTVGYTVASDSQTICDLVAYGDEVVRTED